MLSFALNYALGQYDPIGYHLVNVFLHVINGLSLWLLARFKDASTGGAPAGLVFVAHPVLGEPVNYISSRSSLMATPWLYGRLSSTFRGDRPGGLEWPMVHVAVQVECDCISRLTAT